MTNYWMHMDPEAFPNPHVFDPTRWMCEPAKLRVMYRYFVPFSKGSRACIGREYV
jgi:cytochrome P450